MRALGTLLALAVLAAASGCGQQSGTTSAPDTDACAGKGTTVARADLDGNGSLEPVRLTGQGSGPCAHRLLAPGGAAYDVSGLDLVPKGATVVHLRGDGRPTWCCSRRSRTRAAAPSRTCSGPADRTG